MDLSSLLAINENNKMILNCTKDLVDVNNEDKKSSQVSSTLTINHLTSSSRRKQLKQHNQELEEHLRQQQSEHDFCRQDSFLKKFSTRSHQTNHSANNESLSPNEHFKDTQIPLSNRKLKQFNRFSYTSTNSQVVQHKKQNEEQKIESSKLMAPKNNITILKASNSLIKSSITSSSSSISTSSRSKKSLLKFYFNKLLIKCNYFVLSPDDNCMFVWLIILNLCILYNIWLVIARQSFDNLQSLFSFYWTIADSISDTIYLLDVFIQFRTGYLEQGLLVYDSKKLAINYLKSKNFLLDIFSLAPFELLQLHLGYSMPMLRFPRFFKVYRTIELYYITESRTLYPNVWRVTNLTHILFLLGHWFAGFYFLISKAEGFKGRLLFWV